MIASPSNSVDDASTGHHHRAVCELDHLLVVGGRDQHPDAARSKLAHRAVELGARSHVDAASGLDHHEQRRAALEPPSEHDLLLIAARERADGLERVVARADR